ncbi:MAG: serine/threonine protein kinase [Verrucomicrobia bacterium]|nr:serine/threonine protein kinase [Verrucomicrobiota bacterium]
MMSADQSKLDPPRPVAPDETPTTRSSAAPSNLSPTVPVIPDHELLRCIGRGSYGEVWLARNVMGTLRAVKIVYRRTFETGEPFEREFKGIQKFEPISRSHDGLVDVLQIGRNDAEGYFYYVMELADDAGGAGSDQLSVVSSQWSVAGGQLSVKSDQSSGMNLLKTDDCLLNTYSPKTLREELRRRGRLPAEECLSIALMQTSALAHLHQHGLVHRDIKPSNIIFVNGVPKLADIGLVAEASEARSYVGTVGYIPPEGPGTPQADLYSLGKVIYEISTGKDRQQFPALPSDLRTLEDADELVELNEVVLRACDSEAGKRYSSAQAMREDLVLLSGGRSVKRLRLVERRLALAMRAAVVVTGFLVLLLGAYGIQRSRTKQAEREKALVEEHARTLRRHLYAADVKSAQRALDEDNLGEAHELLERYFPQPGEEDLRGFEWRYLWKLCQGDAIHTFAESDDPIAHLAFSSDGKILATAIADGTVKLWDLETKKPFATLLGPRTSPAINGLAFSPDAKLLAVGDKESVFVFDTATRQVRRKFSASSQRIVVRDYNPVAFSSDGKLLATRGESNQIGILIRDTRTWQTRSFFPNVATNHGTFLAFSVDSRLLLVGGNQTVQFWDIDSRLKIREIKADWTAWAFAPRKGLLAGGSFSGSLSVFDTRSDNELSPVQAHPFFVHGLSYSADETRLASCGAGQVIHLWDAKTLEKLGTFRGHRDRVTAVAFSPDGQTVASGSVDKTVKLWRANLPRTEERLDGAQWPVKFSSDGKTLITISSDISPGGRLQFWDLASLKMRDSFRLDENQVHYVAVAPDLKTLAFWVRDGTIRVWDLETRKPRAILRGQTQPAYLGAVLRVVFSPKGRWLASTSYDYPALRLWNLATFREEHSFTNCAREVAFSPDECISRNTASPCSSKKKSRNWSKPTNIQSAVAQHTDPLQPTEEGSNRQIRWKNPYWQRSQGSTEVSPHGGTVSRPQCPHKVLGGCPSTTSH